MDQNDDENQPIQQDPAEVLRQYTGGLQYGVTSDQAIDSGYCNTWWYRVESLDGSPFPVEAEIIGFCDEPTAKAFGWSDKRVYKLVSFVRAGRRKYDEYHREVNKKIGR